MADNPCPWAHPGAEILVGLREPLRPRDPGLLVPAAVTLDRAGRLVVTYTPPDADTPETVDLAILGDTWGAVHSSRSGQGWSVHAFPPESAAHLHWQIKETQIAIARLVNGPPIDEPETAAQITAHAKALQQLLRRRKLRTTSSEPRRAAA